MIGWGQALSRPLIPEQILALCPVEGLCCLAMQDGKMTFPYLMSGLITVFGAGAPTAQPWWAYHGYTTQSSRDRSPNELVLVVGSVQERGCMCVDRKRLL